MMTKKQIRLWKQDAENEILTALPQRLEYIMALAIRGHHDEISRLSHCERVIAYDEKGRELAQTIKVFTDVEYRNATLACVAMGLIDSRYKLTKLGHKYRLYKEKGLLR